MYLKIHQLKAGLQKLLCPDRKVVSALLGRALPLHLQEKSNPLHCPALLGEERKHRGMQGNTAGMLRANPVAVCPAVRIPCAGALTLVD